MKTPTVTLSVGAILFTMLVSYLVKTRKNMCSVDMTFLTHRLQLQACICVSNPCTIENFKVQTAIYHAVNVRGKTREARSHTPMVSVPNSSSTQAKLEGCNHCTQRCEHLLITKTCCGRGNSVLTITTAVNLKSYRNL